ncbi:MAG: LacI family DNA-binding transcriptional regulator [Lachnospiraceae bacterium]
MEKMTIKEIAQICGVGVSTVSRALNDHPDINPQTKEKIKAVIAQYHFIPNNSARNLKRTNTRSIAVLIKGMTNPFFNDMLDIFERETAKKKYTFVLQRVDEYEDEIDTALELLKEKRLNGLVFLGGNFMQKEEKLNQISVPFVISSVGIVEKLGDRLCSSVSVDDYRESYKMTEYLCQAGHRRIAMIAAQKNDKSIGALRYRGYLDALSTYGIEADPSIIKHMDIERDTYSMATGYRMGKELLEQGHEFTALYAIADSLAIGAMRAMIENGKNVPEDYSVAGFDGLDLGAYYAPSLTTIRQPVEEIAKESIDLLFKLIRKKSENRQIILEAELLKRESVRTL